LVIFISIPLPGANPGAGRTCSARRAGTNKKADAHNTLHLNLNISPAFRVSG